jgi:hypothetical protein
MTVLCACGAVVSYVAWECGLARDGTLIGQSPGGPEHVVTVKEQFLTALSIAADALPYVLGASLLIAFIAWAVRRELNARESVQLFWTALFLGWLPGLCLAMGTMGGLFPLVTGVWSVLVAVVSWWQFPHVRARALELVGTALVSSLLYFLG